MTFIKKIYKHLPLGLKEIYFKRCRMDVRCGYGETFRTYIDRAFDTFLTAQEKTDKALKETLKKDIVKCWLKYKALPYEYFLYGFRNLDEQGRSSFITDIDRLTTLGKVSDKEEFFNEINNKYNFYLRAKKYFRREAILLESEKDKDTFIGFTKSHLHIFIKPVSSSKGNGARVYEYVDDAAAAEYFDVLIAQGDTWIAEEQIVQCAEMSRWNPTSVNTIRIPTFLNKGEFTVKWTRMRCGKKGSIVDNAGAGGIIVNVDPVTGVISSDGIDESYRHFEAHPDFGLNFKGWQVPRWNELLAIVEELHRTVFPRQVYVAWDFALTDDGWALVEGNWGQMLGFQTASQTGVRKEFYDLVGYECHF